MKKNNKHVFEQDTGIFFDSFCVSVGLDDEDLLKYAKKENYTKDFIDVVFTQGKFKKQNHDSAATYSDTEHNVYLLSIHEYSNNRKFFGVLVHEINHIVENLSKKKGFENELEAKAYLSEYLFVNISEKIQSGKFILKNICKMKKK